MPQSSHSRMVDAPTATAATNQAEAATVTDRANLHRRAATKPPAKLTRHANGSKAMETGHFLMLALIGGIAAFFYIANRSAKTKRRNVLALHRAHTIAAFASDRPPTVNAPNIVLTKDERVIWSEPAQLFEERVTSRKWEGGSQGISIPTGVLGTRISLGKTQGRLNIERQTIPISTGALVITTHNVLFHGDTKSSKTALSKIITVNCAANGIVIALAGRAKPWTIVFKDPEAGEVVRVALQAAYKHASA